MKNKLTFFSLLCGIIVLIGPSMVFAQDSFDECIAMNQPRELCESIYPNQVPTTGSGSVTGSGVSPTTGGVGGGTAGTPNPISPITGGVGGGTANGSTNGSNVVECGSGYEEVGGTCLPRVNQGGAAGKKTLGELVTYIIQMLLAVAGVIAVVFIIIGGYQYITSAGNDEQAEKGRKTLVNAVIGLVVAIMAYVIVSVVVNLITKGNL